MIRVVQKLEEMKDYWNKKRKQHHEALLQELEHFRCIGDGIVDVWKAINNICEKFSKLEVPDEELRQGDHRLQEIMGERVHLREEQAKL